MSGWRAPERAKKTSIHADRGAREEDDDRGRAREEPERDARVLDVMDGERAEHVRRSPSSASYVATSCFVSWSATTRRDRDGGEAEPLRGSRASDARGGRDRRRGRRSTSRRGRRQPRRLASPRLLGWRWSSMQSVAHGRASSRSAPIGLPQRSHLPYVPSSIRSSAAWIAASTVLGVLLEAVVELAVERLRRRVAGVVVEPPEIVAVSSSMRARVLVLELSSACYDALALLQEQLAEMVDVDARHARPSLGRSRGGARSRRLSPSSSTSLSRACARDDRTSPPAARACRRAVRRPPRSRGHARARRDADLPGVAMATHDPGRARRRE